VTVEALPPGEETHPWVEPEDDVLPPDGSDAAAEAPAGRNPDDTSEVPVVRDEHDPAGGPA